MSFYRHCSSPFDIMEDGSPHSLLEPPCPAYTNVTVRRAFIVWLHCGQRNKFKDVCNYYHYLESLEENLPANKRATSRHHEFDMFTNQPPKSSYLNHYFPRLYSQTFEEQYINKVEAIRNDKCVFKLEGFHEIRTEERATKYEILQASRMIRNYCKSHYMTLRKFLNKFKEYTSKCELNTSVNNVVFYIKRKLIQEELQIIKNCPKTFSFLNSSNDEKVDNNYTKNYNESVNIFIDMPSKTTTLSNTTRKINKQVSSDSNKINEFTKFFDKMSISYGAEYPDSHKSATKETVDKLKGINVKSFTNVSEKISNSLIVDSFMQNMQNKNSKGHNLLNSQYLMTEMTKIRKI